MLFALWRLSTVSPVYTHFMCAYLTCCAPDLHPLSLEDVLHVPGRLRSGADYYKRHLFIRVLSHTLDRSGQGESGFLEQIARSSSPEPLELVDRVEGLPEYPTGEARSSGLTSKFSRKFKSPHKSATVEPGGYDVENVNVSRPPQGGQSGNYGSFYGTYVRTSSFVLPRICLLIPSRTKGKRPKRLFSSSCKNSRKAAG